VVDSNDMSGGYSRTVPRVKCLTLENLPVVAVGRLMGVAMGFGYDLLESLMLLDMLSLLLYHSNKPCGYALGIGAAPEAIRHEGAGCGKRSAWRRWSAGVFCGVRLYSVSMRVLRKKNGYCTYS